MIWPGPQALAPPEDLGKIVMERDSTDTPKLDVRALDARIKLAYGADRYRLRQKLRQLEDSRRRKQPIDRNIQKYLAELDGSIQRRQARVRGLPALEFDSSLPISERRDEIADAICNHQVVVICGETGSGKSTQIPKICLAAGRGVDGLIGHTQPRRIAARSVAARIADELKSPLGQAVGYKIRFNDVTSSDSYIKLMTDGILLAESQGDRFLNDYDTLIIDEAHERSLNIDLLIGYLKQLLPKRRDLKLIITSATIDADRFSEHFSDARGPAPILRVSGRMFPVEVRYRPLVSDENDREPDWQRAIVNAIEEACTEITGDILVFQPTEHDIHETAKLLRGRMLPGDVPGRQTEIVPLYARLSGGDQNRIFTPPKYRRIVIATNVAESSLTVPGIRCVIDPGTARISRYSPRSKMQRLPIEAISQASADQRMGRCGRIGPGVCIRLYSVEDYLSRDQYTPPEIQRTNLAAVILRVKALKLGEIDSFPFLDPPRPEAIRDGYKTLFEVGAFDEKNELTEIGWKLSRIPVDPRIGRIILAGETENCLAEVLIIASALEIQDPRERPIDKQQAADECHGRFSNQESDFLSYLALWDFFHKLRDDLSKSKLRLACQQNYLSFNRIREWIDLHLQLYEVVQQAGLKPRTRRNDYGAIHRALLTGLLSNVGQKSDASNEYTVGGGGKNMLWPGSGVFAKKPKWVVAAEQIETSRKFLRTVARIDPAWIEPLAGHLLSRSYSEPHWDRKSGTVLAFEKVSLFGLILVPRRRVRYGPIEPKIAQEIFIREALVGGEFDTRARFFHHNRELIDRLESLQTKSRRRDLILPEDAQYDFYETHLPPQVFDSQTLDKWLREITRTEPQMLFMSESDLIADDVDPVVQDQFPDTLPIQSLELPIEYRFDPGSDADGLTVIIPQEGLNQVEPQRLGWLVPGLLEEKITAVIKGLPKDLRRCFVPIPDTAKEVFRKIRFGEGNFTSAVARILEEISGERIAPALLEAADIPTHLQMHIRVVAPNGEEIASGKDLSTVRRDLGAEAAAQFTTVADPQWQKDGLTKWDFGPLPSSVPIRRGHLQLTGFPALQDCGESVSLRLLDSEERATRETQLGLRRLFVLNAGRELKAQVDWLPNINQLKLLAATLPDAGTIRAQWVDLLAERAYLNGQTWPRSAEEFQSTLKSGKQRLGLGVQDLAQLLPLLLRNYQDARMVLEQLHGAVWQSFRGDLQSQMNELTAPGFFNSTPWQWLTQYPRYFKSIVVRRSKMTGPGMARDQRLQLDLAPRWHACLEQRQRHREHQIFDPQLETFRWMLEEYRVSVFTQELGTSITISSKRLDEQWARVRII